MLEVGVCNRVGMMATEGVVEVNGGGVWEEVVLLQDHTIIVRLVMLVVGWR